MAISDTTVSSVELVNTFEQWRTKTNQIITVLNENSDTDPASNLISANSLGGLQINTITSNLVTGSNVTGSKLLFSGGTVDFSGATVTDAGTVKKFALTENVGATITGATPDSKIERAQINECEINLNGANLQANGASTITLTGATIADLGTVSLFNAEGGTLNNVNVSVTDTAKVWVMSAPGPHVMTGAAFANGQYNNATSVGGFTHSANISVNTSSYLVSNTAPILGADVTNANVAIGNFPEWDGVTLTAATSARGRLHIRTAFANPGGTATASETNADELILEGNTNVGMTLFANNTANVTIAFGDSDDADRGGILYNHANDEMHIVTDAANTVVFGNEFGGFMQIVGADTYSGSASQAGKLHINVGSTDGTSGVFIDSNDIDQIAISVDAAQTTGNVIDINADTYTEGHVISLHNGLGTGTSHSSNGSLIKITDNNSSTNARAVMDVVQDAAGATGTMGIRVTTDGGQGMFVLQNADKNGVRCDSTADHAEALGYFLSNSTSSTGSTLFVQGKSSTAGTKVFNVQNSSADVMSTLANGSITFHNQAVLAANATANVNCRLAVLDTSGNILNGT